MGLSFAVHPYVLFSSVLDISLLSDVLSYIQVRGTDCVTTFNLCTGARRSGICEYIDADSDGTVLGEIAAMSCCIVTIVYVRLFTTSVI